MASSAVWVLWLRVQSTYCFFTLHLRHSGKRWENMSVHLRLQSVTHRLVTVDLLCVNLMQCVFMWDVLSIEITAFMVTPCQFVQLAFLHSICYNCCLCGSVSESLSIEPWNICCLVNLPGDSQMSTILGPLASLQYIVLSVDIQHNLKSL